MSSRRHRMRRRMSPGCRGDVARCRGNVTEMSRDVAKVSQDVAEMSRDVAETSQKCREMSRTCRRASRKCRRMSSYVAMSRICREMSRDVADVARCREMSRRCREDVAKNVARCREDVAGCREMSRRCREDVAKMSRDVTRRHQMSPSVNFTSHFIKRDDMTTRPHEAGGSRRRFGQLGSTLLSARWRSRLVWVILRVDISERPPPGRHRTR